MDNGVPRYMMYIVCHRYYDLNGVSRAIGGVETYVDYLSKLAVKNCWDVTICQYGNVSKRISLADGRTMVLWRTKTELTRALREMTTERKGLVVYSDFWCTPTATQQPCIILQHGVGWDWSYTRFTNKVLVRVNSIRKWVIRSIAARHIRHATKSATSVLCVDTNFRNYLQARYPEERFDNLVYVPNFAEIATASAIEERWLRDSDKLRCIYPRSYSRIRGALVFASVVRMLSREFENVQFAFVGEGECNIEIRRMLSGCCNVEFYRREQGEMMQEYLRSHVAVIPTLAGEGTSLSCIEAMACGTAVVATAVGGLGNLVLPDYNGILCQPTEKDIAASVRRLLMSRALMVQLGSTAYEVASRTFSLEAWERRVWSVVEEVMGNRR